jgi:hypothetical protein
VSPNRFAGSVAIVLLAACGNDDPASAPAAATIADHVTFYGTGKVARYHQHMDSSLEALGPLFFAEIFIAAGGHVSDASVRFPGGDVYELQYRYSESEAIGDVMYLSGMVDSDAALEERYPSGAYAFTFRTPGGDVAQSIVSFEGGGFPAQPVIIFEQSGSLVSFDAVDPAADLVITWPPFSEGGADPNGILDDLVFVAIDSCTVEDIVHSGRPFENDDHLTYRDERYVVPAGTLEPGQTYSMYVEHALLPHTQAEFGMPAFATFAASTYMDFRTAGQTDPSYCEGSAE